MGQPGCQASGDDGRDLWVFGYGSLMWRPGFAFVACERARLDGFERRFCIYSTHHRGSQERPGLVLGLDRGGSCEGIAYRVAEADRVGVLAYLREREQVNGVYRETTLAVELLGAVIRRVPALGYVAEARHPSYAGRLPPDVQARIIRSARGISGANLDYLLNTLEHLCEIGIEDRGLNRIMALAGPVFRREAGPARPAIRGLIASESHFAVLPPRMRPTERRRFVFRRQLSLLAGR